MRLEILDFVAEWGEPIDPLAVSEGHFLQYGDRLPELMLDMWREIGFAGFGDGLLWICDPRAWQPIVDTWLAGLDLPELYAGEHIPLFRTAYGEIHCFKPGLGLNVTVIPVTSKIGLIEPNPVGGQRWIDMHIESLLKYPADLFLVDADSVYDSDDDQDDLFPRLVERLGPTTHDTVYSFSPSTQEDGIVRVETAFVADAASELTRLRTLKTPETFIA